MAEHRTMNTVIHAAVRRDLRRFTEDTLFWPALVEVGADERLMTALAGEHDRMAAAMTGTRSAMTPWRPSRAPAMRSRPGRRSPS